MNRKYLLTIGIMILLAITICIFWHIGKSEVKKDIYSFSGDTMSYSMDREKPDYEMSLLYTNDTINVYAINFTSRNFMNYSTRIFGLLFMPANVDNTENLPGLVFLPAGAAKKEQDAWFGLEIARQGYVVLIIDQRGIGQTGGYYLDMQHDFEVFSQGYEPIQHLSVYDALRSFDVLRNIKGVNQNDIALSGESMGGRYTMIASALDNRIKGVLVISSSGFNIPENRSNMENNYLVSIDPDHYIGMIKPRYLFMLHSDNDSVVKLSDAEHTYSLAGEKKSFFLVQGCTHGYCNKMQSELYSDLKTIFSN